MNKALFSIMMMSVALVGCEKSQEKPEGIIEKSLAEEKEKPIVAENRDDYWRVNTGMVDRFTNEDNSTATLVSAEILTGNPNNGFERTKLIFTARKVPNKADGIGYLTFGYKHPGNSLTFYVESMPKCLPKCEILVRFDEAPTEKYNFKNDLTKAMTLENGKVVPTSNRLVLSPSDSQHKKFFDKFMNASLIEMRVPMVDDKVFDYKFTAKDKVRW